MEIIKPTETCSQCGSEFISSSMRLDRDFGCLQCPICGKWYCSDCAEGKFTSIDIEDFKYSQVCDECLTDELLSLIIKAETTQSKLSKAEQVHWNACSKLEAKIEQMQEESKLK